MAEGYVTRRGLAGSGGPGELNVWTGDSPPEDEVGVYVDCDIPDPIVYIVPYGSMDSDGLWTIDSTLAPDTGYMYNPVVYNNMIVVPFASTNNIYSFDKTTSTFSLMYNVALNFGISRSNASTLNGNVLHLFASYSASSSWDRLRDTMIDLATGISTVNSIAWNYQDEFLTPAALTYAGNPYVIMGTSDDRNHYVRVIRGTGDTTAQFSSVSSSIVLTKTIYNLTGSGASWGTMLYLSLCYRYRSITAVGVYSYDVMTGEFLTRGAGSSAPNANTMWANDSSLFAAVTGTTWQEMDLNTNTWTVKDALPLETNSNNYSAAINTGDEFLIFGCGAGQNQILRNKRISTDFQYPSVIIENGTQQNQAEIISGDNGTSTINVRQVYMDESGTPQMTSGQVRITGGEWTAIT